MKRARNRSGASRSLDWTSRDIARLAWLAGRGASMAALADDLRRSPESIRAQLSRLGLDMLARGPFDVAALVVFDRPTWSRIAGLAAGRAVEPAWLVAAMVRELARPEWGEAMRNLADSAHGEA